MDNEPRSLLNELGGVVSPVNTSGCELLLDESGLSLDEEYVLSDWDGFAIGRLYVRILLSVVAELTF